MEWLLGNKLLVAVWGFASVFLKQAAQWLLENRDKIQAIVLRIEKDAQDGWTNEEKEQLAMDIFYKELYPKLPWILKLVPKSWLEKWVKDIIHSVCEKAHALKDRVEEIKK